MLQSSEIPGRAIGSANKTCGGRAVCLFFDQFGDEAAAGGSKVKPSKKPSARRII